MGPQQTFAKLISFNDHAHAVAASQSVVFLALRFSFNLTTLDSAGGSADLQKEMPGVVVPVSLHPSAHIRYLFFHVHVVLTLGIPIRQQKAEAKARRTTV